MNAITAELRIWATVDIDDSFASLAESAQHAASLEHAATLFPVSTGSTRDDGYIQYWVRGDFENIIGILKYLYMYKPSAVYTVDAPDALIATLLESHMIDYGELNIDIEDNLDPGYPLY